MKKEPEPFPAELAEDPEFLALSEKERERLVAVMEKMLEMGIGAVYGVEENGADARIDCRSRIAECRARCCTYHFALTKKEVEKGHIRHNPQRPFFIARDTDGYCPHLNRTTLLCRIWSERPQRCRKYDCTKEDLSSRRR